MICPTVSYCCMSEVVRSRKRRGDGTMWRTLDAFPRACACHATSARSGQAGKSGHASHQGKGEETTQSQNERETRELRYQTHRERLSSFGPLALILDLGVSSLHTRSYDLGAFRAENRRLLTAGALFRCGGCVVSCGCTTWCGLHFAGQ